MPHQRLFYEVARSIREAHDPGILRIPGFSPALAAVLVGSIITNGAVLPAADLPAALTAARPDGDDFTAASLLKYERATVKHYGHFHKLPLDVKAAHYEWVMRRYHLAPTGQVHPRVILPAKTGPRPRYYYGADNSTWNGALLAAMSYKYAVTKDADTLRFLGRLIDGLHFFQKVTGKAGLAARCVLPGGEPIADAKHRFVDSDGKTYWFRADPAKGTYNQLVAGYAALMMHAYHALPRDKQRRARDDMAALVMHLVEHKNRLNGRDGKPTTYGDLRPVIATQSVPFNAQVAYMIVATGTYFPPSQPAAAKRIRKAYRYLKNKHHVYYEDPRTHLVVPQRVAANPFIKGTNDRNHVVNAAYTGLMLELLSARKQGRKPDRKLLYQLGRTIYWAMTVMKTHRHALCNFMWAGVLKDPRAFRDIIPKNRDACRRQLKVLTADGIEQLQRFPIVRFGFPGKKVVTKTPQWVDVRKRHDGYLWKSGPYDRWDIIGPPGNVHVSSIDYLYAYWLMRYFELDKVMR
ncbi:MAG: hypothetical protein ACE5KM_07185 [Planctomycetaceae bacterium]